MTKNESWNNDQRTDVLALQQIEQWYGVHILMLCPDRAFSSATVQLFIQ